MRIVNVAHGEFFMLGAVVTWYVSTATGSYLLALAAAPLAVGTIAVLADRLVLRRIGYDPEGTIVATIGLLYILQQLVLTTYGPYARPVTAPVYFRVETPWFGYSGYKLVVSAVAALLLAATWVALGRTRLGLYMRATQQDREIAQAFAVPVNRVYTVAFGAGAGLAAVAGALIVPIQQAHYLMVRSRSSCRPSAPAGPSSRGSRASARPRAERRRRVRALLAHAGQDRGHAAGGPGPRRPRARSLRRGGGVTGGARARVLGLHLAVLALLAGAQFLLPPFHHGMLARIMVLAAWIGQCSWATRGS
jgi:hypothetical protein